MQERRPLLFAAGVCVAVGVYFVTLEDEPDVAPWFLLGGLLYAILYLVLTRRGR